MRTLTYYVATTLDGFIADPSGGFEFFPVEGDHMYHLMEEYPETLPVHVRDQLAVTSPGKHFDAVVMGRRTWEPSLSVGLTSAYPHLQQYVFSKTLTQAPDDTVTLVATDPLEYVRDLKKQDGRGIWLCGGATLAGELLPEIDELVLKVNPIIAGNGIPLFRTGFEPHYFELSESRVFDSGVVINHLSAKR
ncbi:dihydrofolate reductase [Rhodococcus sp. SMB37]|uniref:dihydrofolate reductase family protein n=1 Tax=Rhodococcus sp. SMB37 TaxID=2512213 RepID=UPI0006CF8171|nr:dihydrofolate reductase family protein [Rhodococcus sp. SMB37]TCN52767.1 dihydrofolate reductase [Rhodococcus sp. SMB37]